ncbi:MAG: response regulator [Candidatus Limivivens sp.]|nr:response regulator [Candidatus Limivivens sp.]
MDGLELCGILHERMPGIKLVILSAYDDFDYAKNALLYGVKDYLLKPIDYQKIMDIAKMLRSMSEEEEKKILDLSKSLNPAVEQQLFQLLTNENPEPLTETLRKILSASSERDHATPPHAALTLTRLLYIYLQRLELSPDILGKTLDQSLALLHRQLSPALLTDYLVQEYMTLH